MSMTYDDFGVQAAPVRDALLAIGKAVDNSGLEKTLTELVKLRASQINGCAFCIAFHLQVARRLGIPGDKLDLVAAWHDTDIFSPRERAALALTEALTRLDDLASGSRAVPAEHFSATETLHLMVAIGAINHWNRIAIGLQFPPPSR